MISALYVIYRVIVAILALLAIWDIIREKTFVQAINLGIISVPLILRALMIK